jgi:hypothetical protein
MKRREFIAGARKRGRFDRLQRERLSIEILSLKAGPNGISEPAAPCR